MNSGLILTSKKKKLTVYTNIVSTHLSRIDKALEDDAREYNAILNFANREVELPDLKMIFPVKFESTLLNVVWYLSQKTKISDSCVEAIADKVLGKEMLLEGLERYEHKEAVKKVRRKGLVLAVDAIMIAAAGLVVTSKWWMS
ncbi:hypothetical protein V6259_13020 [Marinomonas sp. TI.3.20]|uniref:hypothetical protein n=1 Tax=Marinomonas sp. TI.3.20 TaxID=3121296 RepID=UPI00311E1E9E